MSAFFVCFSSHDPSEICELVRIFPLINYAHLPHGYDKTTLSFHNLSFLPSPCCFFFFFFRRQTQLLRWKEGQTQSLAFCPAFSRICSPERAAVATYESAELGGGHCEGTIRHNLLREGNIERRREKTRRGFVGVGGL